MPGASVSRHPRGCRSAPSSPTSASARPVMSACAPRPGSSGRCGRSGSSPSTTRTARSIVGASLPGHGPDAGGARHAVTPVPRRAGDRARADHPRAVVDDRGLTRRDPLRRVEQVDDDVRSPVDRRRRHGARRRAPAAGRCRAAAAVRGGAAPARPDALDAVDGELLAGPDGHGAGDRLDVEDVARLAVGGGPADPQPLALADGEARTRRRGCRAPRRSRGRRSRPAPAPSRSRRKPAVSPSEMKQMSWLSGLSRDGEAAPRGLGADLRLAASRRAGTATCASCSLGEHAEHVGLVLGRVDRAVQLDGRPARRRAARSGRWRPRRSRAPRPGRARRRT